MIKRFDDFESMQKFEAENEIIVQNIFRSQQDYKYDDGTYHYTLYEYILVYEEKEVENGEN